MARSTFGAESQSAVALWQVLMMLVRYLQEIWEGCDRIEDLRSSEKIMPVHMGHHVGQVGSGWSKLIKLGRVGPNLVRKH